MAPSPARDASTDTKVNSGVMKIAGKIAVGLCLAMVPVLATGVVSMAVNQGVQDTRIGEHDRRLEKNDQSLEKIMDRLQAIAEKVGAAPAKP